MLLLLLLLLLFAEDVCFAFGTEEAEAVAVPKDRPSMDCVVFLQSMILAVVVVDNVACRPAATERHRGNILK
jgi:hypothetical protein